MKKTITILLALSLLAGICSLIGCAGKDGETGSEDVAKGFVGVWELHSLEVGGTVSSGEEIEAMKELGVNVTLILAEDGRALFDSFGTEYDCTWEAIDATTSIITIENEQQELKLDDDVLKITVDGKTMGLKKQP